jgi:hypothetical protein
VGPHRAAEPLQSQQHTEEQGQIGGEGQLVVVHDLHPGRHHRGHVQVADTTAEVAVEPGLDLTRQPVAIKVARRAGQLDHDVHQLIHVPGGHGYQQRLELIAARAAQMSDVAEVEDGQVTPVGQQEVPRVRVRVVKPVAEDHLQVDVRSPADQRVDVPTAGDHAVSTGAPAGPARREWSPPPNPLDRVARAPAATTALRPHPGRLGPVAG